MSNYDELPNDYRSYWLHNVFYELYNFMTNKKLMEHNENNIIIYQRTITKGKQTFTHTLKYNKTIQNYDIDGKRFINYKDVLDHMWNL